MNESCVQEPKIVEFGPYRVIGMNYIGKNENQEFANLWNGENGFIKRMGEVKRDTQAGGVSFGVCRCVPGMTDGGYEYIAGLPASEDAPIPDGMMEAYIGRSTYAVFEVPNLAELERVWSETQPWLDASPDWYGTCGPGMCECPEHPYFEVYPADFTPESKCYIYVSVHPRNK